MQRKPWQSLSRYSVVLSKPPGTSAPSSVSVRIAPVLPDSTKHYKNVQSRYRSQQYLLIISTTPRGRTSTFLQLFTA